MEKNQVLKNYFAGLSEVHKSKIAIFAKKLYLWQLVGTK